MSPARRHDPAMTPNPAASPEPVGWQDRLDRASTADEVVETVREFVARWSPEELAELPQECRPGKIVDAEDLNGVAVAMVHRSCADDRLGDDRLQRLAAFFTHAAMRIVQINSRAAREAARESERSGESTVRH